MSDMLGEAIVDAKSLRAAALKNAENIVIEKYSTEVRKTLENILEQDEAIPGLDDLDAGVEHAIRQSLIELAKNGTSIIVISQDLDELIEITHRLSVIFNGKLSKSYDTREISISKIGLLMGGQQDD